MNITLTLNGSAVSLECRPFDTLLAVLRRQELISVRYGSDTGETGASAVLIDGPLALSRGERKPQLFVVFHHVESWSTLHKAVFVSRQLAASEAKVLNGVA